ncbi:hypothetical protein ABT279_35715, partial [Amycolatopsis sp. NPDC000673]|uniref:hypothetical protein n=1 Tax=Amycolatopsis sp. NPDC000673 TaxID=3154267 RepID=UPI00331B166B
MTVRVAIDFGTSSTCVVVSVNGREPQVVVIDGQPLMSSAVYAASDGTLFVGQEAERQQRNYLIVHSGLTSREQRVQLRPHPVE